jgi:hypothetical protein
MSRVSAWSVLALLVVLVGLAATHPIPERQLSIREEQNLVFGDLVPDETAAIGIAEALIRGRFGEEALRKLQPMTAREGGTQWNVFGRTNQGQPLPVTVSVSKADAAVELFYVEFISRDEARRRFPEFFE